MAEKRPADIGKAKPSSPKSGGERAGAAPVQVSGTRPRRPLEAWLIRDYVDVPPSRLEFSRPVSREAARRFLWSKQPAFDALVPDPNEEAASGRQMSWLLDAPSTQAFYSAASSMEHGLGEQWQRNWQPFAFTPRSKGPLDRYTWLTAETRAKILALPNGEHRIPATRTIGDKEYDAEIVIVKRRNDINFFQRKPGEKALEEIFGPGRERAAHLHGVVAREREDRVLQLLEMGFSMDDAEAIYRTEVEDRWKALMFTFAYAMHGGARISQRSWAAQPTSRYGGPRTVSSQNQRHVPVIAPEPGSSRSTGGPSGGAVRATRTEVQPGGGVAVRSEPVLVASPSAQTATQASAARPAPRTDVATQRSTWTTDPASVEPPGAPYAAGRPAPAGATALQRFTSTDPTGVRLPGESAVPIPQRAAGASPSGTEAFRAQQKLGAGVRFPARPDEGGPRIAPGVASRDRPTGIDPVVPHADVTAPGEREELGPIGDPASEIDSVEFARLPPGVKRMTLLIREMYRRLPMHINPVTNEWVSRRGGYQADHFVPVTFILNRIVGKHIKELTADQITELLTYEGNFQPVPPGMNQSKAGTLPSQWMTFRGKPIRAEYRKEARRYEVKIITDLTSMMNRFLAENRQRKQRVKKPKKR